MRHLFAFERLRASRLAATWVVPDPTRCVQCGICSYNCPLGIDVRAFVWRGMPVSERRCLACSQCISRCPRGALRFAPISAEQLPEKPAVAWIDAEEGTR